MRGSETVTRPGRGAARIITACLTVVFLALVSACGSDSGAGGNSDAPESPRAASTLVEVMRALGEGLDYERHDSPAALGAAASLSVVGRVLDVADGRVFGSGPTRQDEPVMLNVTLTVRVEKVLSGDPSLVRDGLVYVELSRTKAYPGSTFRRATPPNQRLILFLDNYTAGPGTFPLLEAAPTIPSGAPVLAPYADGFLLEDGASGEVVGGYDPLDERAAPWRQSTSGVDAFVAKHFPSA